MDFLELFELNESINKCRESCDYLFENDLIDKETKHDIEMKIKEIEKNNYCFVTKTFRTCDAMGKTLFYFMKSLQRNVRNK